MSKSTFGCVAQDEQGRWVQHQYKESGKIDMTDGEIVLQFIYDGPVVDTGISFSSRELTPDEHTEERIKNATEGAIDAYDE